MYDKETGEDVPVMKFYVATYSTYVVYVRLSISYYISAPELKRTCLIAARTVSSAQDLVPMFPDLLS